MDQNSIKVDLLKIKLKDLISRKIVDILVKKELPFKKIQEMAEEIRTGKINFDELTQEDQENMENFQKRVVIGWGTGSKVSAELVETPPNHTMPHHPIIKSEPKKSTDKTPLRTAF